MDTGTVDTLAFGTETHPGPARWRLSTVVVAAALALGFLAGGHSGAQSWWGDEERPVEAGSLPVVAGSVRESGTVADHVSFELSFYNAGHRPVSVALRSVGPVSFPVGGGPVVALAGRSRGDVRFVVPPTCAFDPTAPYESVTVHLTRGPGAGRRVVLPLLEPGPLPGYVSSLCAIPTAPTLDEVVGLWLLEEAYGRWTGGEGVHLLRFDEDGSYAADSQGRGLSGRVAVKGRWWLEGGVLETRVDGGYACNPGATGVWQASVRTHRMLDLRNVRGTCPYDPGGVWLLRKLSGVEDPGE